MNRKHSLLIALALVAFCATSLLGQASLTPAALSAAVNGCKAGATNTCQKVIGLTSATGILAPANPTLTSEIGTPTGNSSWLVWVDAELMRVLVVNGTSLTVQRGYSGTAAAAHASGAAVLYGPENYFSNYDRYGACTAATEKVLPVVNIRNAAVFTCGSSGQWIKIGDGTMRSAVIESLGAFCTGTTGSAETEYLNSVPTSAGVCAGATTSYARYVVTVPGVLYGLQVGSSAVVVGGTNKDVMTVYRNGSSTIITCTIAAGAQTCADTTHSVAVAAGDYLTFQFVTATSDTAANITASVGIY